MPKNKIVQGVGYLMGKDRNPLNNKYTPEEQDQMNVLQQLYIKHICDTLPAQLDLHDDASKPRATAHPQNFQKGNWQLGHGLLHIEAAEVLAELCAYQLERHQSREFNYLDDPVNLFCEEFKYWLANTLSHRMCDEETLIMVKKRRAYLEAVEKSTAFAFKAGSKIKSLQLTTLHLGKQIDEIILPKIQVEIANTSAREHLMVLKAAGSQVVSYLVHYLYFILRDTEKTPINVVLRDIREGKNKAFQPILDSNSGMCLQWLLNTPYLLCVIPGTQAAETNSVIQLAANVTIDNGFLDNEGKAKWPGALASSRVNSIESALRSKDAGIAKEFHLNANVLHSFVTLHGLVFEFSRLLILCEKAYQLAGIGGDLLVYGLASQQLNQLLNSFLALKKSVELHVGVVSVAAKTHYEAVINAQKKGGSWLDNYKQVSSIVKELERNLTQVSQTIETIQNNANSLSLTGRVKQAHESTIIFIQESHKAVNQFNHYLGLPQVSNVPLLQSKSVSDCDLPSSAAACIDGPSPLSSTFSDKSSTSDAIKEDEVIDLYGTSAELLSDRMILRALQGSTSSLNKVKKIYLQKNKLTHESLTAITPFLMQCTNLVHLELFRNTFSGSPDKAGQALAIILQHPRLGYLDINETGLGIKGTIEFCKGLAVNRIIYYLDIGYNGIGDDGVMALIEALKSHPKISNLRLGGNGITALGAAALLNFVRTHPCIKAIDLSNNEIADDNVILQDIQCALKEKCAESNHSPSFWRRASEDQQDVVALSSSQLPPRPR